MGNTGRTYDANGNTATIGTGGMAKNFTFDDRNRLRDFKIGNNLKASYRYNGRGERVLKTDAVTPANSEQFVYDPAGHLIGEYTTTGTRIKEYVWLDDTLVAILGSFDGSNYHFVETDALGTPRAVIHPTKNQIEWRWDLNPTAFGEHAPSGNPDGDALTYTLNLRFSGQYYDAESGINYNTFRDYEAATGRYIESDPIGLAGGASTYSYAISNPMSNVDPLGLFNLSATQIAIDNDESTWEWKYAFSFSEGCASSAALEFGQQVASRRSRAASWLARALSGVDAHGARPAGDADVLDYKARCECMNFDPELATYFKNVLKGIPGKNYEEADASIYLGLLKSKFAELQNEKCNGNADCMKATNYYNWGKLIEKARDRGAKSLKAIARDHL